MTWVLLAAAMLVLPGVAPAQWYEWRDANGTVHVTNQFADQAARPSPPPVEAPPAAADPRQDELRRRQARLAERQTHLRLLRGAAANDAASLELENLLEDEVRAEAAAIAALETTLAERQ